MNEMNKRATKRNNYQELIKNNGKRKEHETNISDR